MIDFNEDGSILIGLLYRFNIYNLVNCPIEEGIYDNWFFIKFSYLRLIIFDIDYGSLTNLLLDKFNF